MSSSVAGTGCCCDVTPCDGSYYILFPYCGSMDTNASCYRVLKSVAQSAGFSRGDYIYATSSNTALRHVYILECENTPPPECVGYGPDMQCQDALDGTAGSYTTLGSLVGYTKCTENDCATCLTDGYPHPNSLPTCAERFGYCAGTGEESSNDNTPCLQCIELDVTNVSFSSTAGRYPGVSLSLDSVSSLYLGGNWDNFGGVPASRCGGQQVVALIIDYTLTQERDECCDEPFGCPPPDFGCCDNNDCGNGRYILYVVVDVQLSTGIERVRNSSATTGILSYNPLPYWGFTNQPPPGCTINLQTEGFAVESVTNPSTPYANRTDCLSCDAFDWVGSFVRNFKINTSGFGGLCEPEDTSSSDYFELTVDFHVKKILP